MISVDVKNWRRLEHALGKLAREKLPKANIDTVNDAAFMAMRLGKENIAKKMILRNKWTVKQVKVRKANGRRKEARVGAVPDFLAKQEFGGTSKKPIPTTYSSGEGFTNRRLKMPRKPNQLKNIQLGGKPSAKTRRQRNIVAIRSGEKNVWLDFGKRKGLFRVLAPKSRKPKIRMLWSIDGKRRRIPKRDWLGPAVVVATHYMPDFYAKHLEKQLNEAGFRDF